MPVGSKQNIHPSQLGTQPPATATWSGCVVPGNVEWQVRLQWQDQTQGAPTI